LPHSACAACFGVCIYDLGWRERRCQGCGDNWADAFSAETPDRLLALYDREAVLWGTLSPKRRDDPEAIRDYMVNAFKALHNHKVSFGDQLIRVYGDTAINTGYYTFTYTKDGESKSLPARYSFVYKKRDGKWMIVDHHSSAMPVPPK
jgi:uncharacterized protein (TIGR02246 family)